MLCKILLLVVLLKLLNTSLAFADATPFKSTARVEFCFQKGKPFLADSIGIIVANAATGTADTIFDCKDWYCVHLNSQDELKLTRSVPDSFRVILISDGKATLSPLLYENGLSSYYRLKVTDEGIFDITPLFRTPYRNYFLALAVTILLELLVAWRYFSRRRIPLRMLSNIILVNLISHPILWLISANFTGFAWGNLVGEPMVVFAEATLLYFLISKRLSLKQCFWLSLFMNLLSFFVGGLLYLIVAE